MGGGEEKGRKGEKLSVVLQYIFKYIYILHTILSYNLLYAKRNILEHRACPMYIYTLEQTNVKMKIPFPSV